MSEAAQSASPPTDSSVPSFPSDVVVRRSARRRSSATAFREGGRTVVVVPARLTPEQEARCVRALLEQMSAKAERRASDEHLMQRARELSARYLGGLALPSSVRWVTNQNSRWGSCTALDGTIRLSHRLQAMPGWVVDSVLVHELAHLLETGHGPRFQALVASYPQTDRARAFLHGAAHAWANPM